MDVDVNEFSHRTDCMLAHEKLHVYRYSIEFLALSARMGGSMTTSTITSTSTSTACDGPCKCDLVGIHRRMPSAQAMGSQKAASGRRLHCRMLERISWKLATWGNPDAAMASRAPSKSVSRFSTRGWNVGIPAQAPKKTQVFRTGAAPPS